MTSYQEMTGQQLASEFYKIWRDSRVSRSNINRYVKNHHASLYTEIASRTCKLNAYMEDRKKNGKLMDVSVFERLYCLEHRLDDRPMCIECKTCHVAGFMPYKNEYSQYCSQACQKHSSIQAHRGLEKKIQKYGKGNATNAKKAHETRLKKYGSHHPADFGAKVKASKLQRHGDENYVNADKIKMTVEKHKAENPDYYLEREQKSKATKVKNGHDPNWNNRAKFKETIASFSEQRKQEIKDKRKQTSLEDYGCEFPTQCADVQDRRRKTCQELYGVNCVLSIGNVRRAAAEGTRREAWLSFMSDRNAEVIPLFAEEEFISSNSHDKLWRWQCKKCKYEFEHVWKGFSRRCPACHPRSFHEEQRELVDFMSSICQDDQLLENCRSILSNGRELDIVDLDKRIAVEFNGLIWHNVDKRIHGANNITREYHFDKTSDCNALGYRLVHVFEDEWLDNAKLCKSKLRKILAPSSLRHVDASCCDIAADLPCIAQDKFMQKYSFCHKTLSIAYALKLNGHAVAMMAFAKLASSRYDWEVLDYAELNNATVEGGFSKLVTCFASQMDTAKICWHASRDWFSKNDINAPMRIVETCGPRLHWMKKQSRFDGDEIPPVNMHEWLKHVDNSKSFLANMNANGFYRTYDSGAFLCEYDQNLA